MPLCAFAGIYFNQLGLACARRRKGVRVISGGIEKFLVLAQALRDWMHAGRGRDGLSRFITLMLSFFFQVSWRGYSHLLIYSSTASKFGHLTPTRDIIYDSGRQT